MIRLNRYIASATNFSRRQAESFIRRGDISINGHLVSDLATKVNYTDIVKLHGKVIKPLKLVYYVLHKPLGYVCTANREQADLLVTDLVPSDVPVFPVGRLDKNTTGLIVLTNDGELAQIISHPKHQTEKEYLVVCDKKISATDSQVMLKGIDLSGKIMKFDEIVEKDDFTYQVILHQGYNRQIRLMFGFFGYQVLQLCRVRLGRFILRDLPVGKYLKLSFKDIKKYFI